MKPEGSSGAQSSDARTRKKEDDAMVPTSQAHVELCKTILKRCYFSYFLQTDDLKSL